MLGRYSTFYLVLKEGWKSHCLSLARIGFVVFYLVSLNHSESLQQP
jgi:hypothetical protein